jgi:hypothetical protein
MTDTSRFVGIDISKSPFDIRIVPHGRTASFANSAAGIAGFLAAARPASVGRDEMTACLTSDPDRSSKADVLMSLTGSGRRTACFLIAGRMG